MPLILLIIAVGIILGVVLVLLKVSPTRSKLEIRRQTDRFPLVSGANLSRKRMVFPRDFGGQYNLVLVPFQQIQQRSVNTGIPVARELVKSSPVSNT